MSNKLTTKHLLFILVSCLTVISWPAFHWMNSRAVKSMQNHILNNGCNNKDQNLDSHVILTIISVNCSCGKCIFCVLLISTTGQHGFKQTTCTVLKDTFCTLGNLSPATTYYFKVLAYSKDHKDSVFSNVAFATTNTSSKSADFFFLSCQETSVFWQKLTEPLVFIKNIKQSL